MNKLTNRLLIALLLVSGAIKADPSATNKTFLAVRPAGVNLAHEQTTWHTQINKRIEEVDDKIGGNFQAVGFFQDNTNEEELGKYFGFGQKRTLLVGPIFDQDPPAGQDSIDIDSRHLIYMPYSDSIPQTLRGTINLSFEHMAAGIRLDYFQDLDEFLKGTYLKLRAPIVYERTKANLGASCFDVVKQETIYGASRPEKTIIDYFSGDVVQAGYIEVNAGQNEYHVDQEGLKYAKITGVAHDQTALADVDLILGWNFYETKKHHIGANIGVTLPTGYRPDGEFLFESVGGGNRGHWAFGAGLDAKFCLYNEEEENRKLELMLVADYRYLFEDGEWRTLGLKGKNWGQYFLLGEIGKKKVFPAANVLTQELDVRPGSQLDLLAGFAYTYENWVLDLGYNLYVRADERVQLKDEWNESKYAIAGRYYNCYDTFAQDNGATFANVTIDHARDGAGGTNPPGVLITKDHLDLTAAETPSYITHKIYGGVGHVWTDMDTPVMVGIGGFYEFATDSQEQLSNWSLHAKIGVTF